MITFIRVVRDDLAAAGDPARAVQQQAYMKSEMPYYGLTAGELKALLRPILVEHRFEERAAWETTARLLWDGAPADPGGAPVRGAGGMGDHRSAPLGRGNAS